MLAVALSTVVGLGTVAAACTSGEQQGNAESRVAAWVTDVSIGETIGTLQGDDARIATALREHLSPNTLHAVCAVLEADASSADSTLPAPDSELTDELNNAYRAELAAANDCFNGATQPASTLLTSSVVQRNRAGALLAAAMARITQITGRTPPTTTTTSAGGDIPGL